MKSQASAVVVFALMCSCAPRGRDVIAVEPNDLGITEVEVRHEHLQDDQLLTLRGYDQDGAVLATAVLRTGMVMYGADTPEALNPGTELKLTVADVTSSFVSPDRVPHMIYEPLSAEASTFVGLKAVASEIDREAGIRFAQPRRSASTEIPFVGTACSGSRFPSAKGGSTQCCQDDSNTWHVNAALAVANRFTYAPVYPTIPVCRKSDGTTGCTGSACLYGPCGSAVGTITGTNGHIFHPTSQPTVCGRDDGSGTYYPEPYSSQTLYGGVTATCLCTGCNADGTPQCGFSDDFNRTSGLGSPWTITQGGYNTDGAYAVTTTNQNWAVVLPTPALGTNNYAVSAVMSVPLNSSNGGVFSRSNNDPYNYSANLYAVHLDEAANAINLWRKKDWDGTHLQTAPVTITPDTMYTIKLVTTGSNPVHCEVWLDGIKKIDFDDWSTEAQTTGEAGMGNYDANAKYDSFKVEQVPPPSGTPPPPPTSGPFIDDFNRTTGLGSNWSVRWGAYTTNGSEAVSTLTPGTGQGDWARVIPDIVGTNYSVTANLSIPSGSFPSGIFSRASDNGEFALSNYSARLSLSGGGKVYLYKRVYYNWTLLGTYSTTITAGTTYNLKLVTTGSNPVHLEVWLGGTKRIEYDDSAADRLTTGGHGIMSYSDNVKFVDYRADAL